MVNQFLKENIGLIFLLIGMNINRLMIVTKPNYKHIAQIINMN